MEPIGLYQLGKKKEIRKNILLFDKVLINESSYNIYSSGRYVQFIPNRFSLEEDLFFEENISTINFLIQNGIVETYKASWDFED